MSTPYLCEIRLISFDYAPKGWAMCNGQIMAINQNQALFSLLGTTYGGNGITTFALPNLQAATPIHTGSSAAGSYTQGETGGLVSVTLVPAQLPAHTHQAQGVSAVANLEPAAGNAWASSSQNPYAASANATMAASTAAQTGGQPHSNMPPYLVMNYVIALQGIFPSRS